MAAYNYIELSGTIVADTSDTKTEVENEYKAVFGSELDLSPGTPQGVLITAETQSRDGVAVNNALLANQINPNIAGGVFLDAIWSLTSGITGGRRDAERSTFSALVDVTGVPGTIIPSGSIALAGSEEYQFESIDEVTLDGSGNGAVGFQSVGTGPITADIGELSTVAAGQVLGWETVNNTVAATLGQDRESDSSSRLRRSQTLALQGISISEAIISSLYNIDGVKSVAYRENYTSSDDTIDGIFLLANSIYACVDGGIDDDIAQALLQNKTAGANYNGTTTVTTTDEFSGQDYDVKFQRPAEIQTWIRVTINPTTVSDPSSVVENAVLNYANGEQDGEQGFAIGINVSPFEIAGAVNREAPEIFVKAVELSTDGISYSVAEISIGLDEVARTDASRITTVIA